MSATAALNMHHHAPPQTYSRLFRPWDTQRREEKIINIKSEHQSSAVNCGSSSSGSSSSRRQSQVQMDAKRIAIKSERSRSSSSSSSSSNSSMSDSSSSGGEGAPIAMDESSVGFSGGTVVVHDTPFNYDEKFAVHQTAGNVAVPPFPMANAASMHHQLCDAPPHLGAFEGASSTAISQLQHQHLQHQQQQLQVPTTTAAAASAAAAAAAGVTPPMPPTMNELYFAASANVAAAAAAVSFGMDPYTLGCMEQEYARIIAEEAHLKALNARKQRPKKFKCPHCDVAFSNNGQLKGHIRIHTGERPFKCDVETCGKTFTRNEELTRHKRIHTGLRPYPCSACGKKFGRRDHLKKHMKTHMPQERQMGAALFMPMYPYLYGC